MQTVTLEGPLIALRESEVRLLMDIAETLAELGDVSQQDRKRLQDVASDLRELFFLVAVIGEFNSGKSSFINALLGDDLLPMGITPTTEVIELIRHGETVSRKPDQREDGIREWTHPNTGAPGVAIVDTPGTGSVFRKHETIAKDFLHRSDLVIFVISAKRAFADAERMYLELAKNYGKKIILVMNQIDLLEPKERTEVRRFIERQSEEMLDLRPLIFMTSAREALAAARAAGLRVGAPGGGVAVGGPRRGGWRAAPPAQPELRGPRAMAERVVRRYQDAVRGNAELVSTDTAKVRDVESELQRQALGLDNQLASARAEVDRVFEGLRMRGISFIDSNLSIRRIGRTPTREQLQIQFQDAVIGRSVQEINEATNGYINAVIDQSRLYWRNIIERLNQLKDLLEQELGGLDTAVYTEQRESLQDAIRIAETELKSYSTGKVIGDIQHNFESNISGFTTSSLAAVSGLVLTALGILTPGPLVGIAAAPLALPAVIVGAPLAVGGGYYALRYYRRVTADTKRAFNQRIDEVERAYHRALQDLTQKERNRLTQYGSQVLTPIFSRLDVLAQRYANQQNALEEYIEQIKVLRRGIEES